MKNTPRILELDYETSPAKGYFFGSIWETNIIQMIEYEQILCIGYKWYGESKVKVIGQDNFKGYKKGILNDKELVKFISTLIQKADMVSAHNGDQFDTPVFNTRLLFHNLPPIPPMKSFDTKKIAKSKFHLPSNKLDDIADFLKIGRKLSTHKSLWFRCEQGDKEAWKYMKSYCANDVRLQSEVLEKVLPFATQINDFISITHRGINCPNATCLSTYMIKAHIRPVKNGHRQQYQCKKCGAYWTDPKLIKNEK